MGAKPIVYIVDDEPAMAKAVGAVVELIGLKTESYGSAEDFLAAYKPAGPGCLVLNVALPGMSGLDLQKKLVEADITLPVIIITGHSDVRMAVGAMKAGAVDFLEKPFRADELCGAIRKAVGLDEENWRRRQS